MENDLDLYCSLVLVMNIGMCDLVILCLIYLYRSFNELRFCIIKHHKETRTHVCIEVYGVAHSSCTIDYQIARLEYLRVSGSNMRE